MVSTLQTCVCVCADVLLLNLGQIKCATPLQEDTPAHTYTHRAHRPMTLHLPALGAEPKVLVADFIGVKIEMSPTSEGSSGGTSGFTMRVHLRVLRCGLKAGNVKPHEIVCTVFAQEDADSTVDNVEGPSRPTSTKSTSSRNSSRRSLFCSR